MAIAAFSNVWIESGAGTALAMAFTAVGGVGEAEGYSRKLARPHYEYFSVIPALQLANFWQDVRRDLLNLNRIYLPRESMAKFAITEHEIAEMVKRSRCDERARELIRFEVDRTEKLFEEGEKLLPLLDAEFRP